MLVVFLVLVLLAVFNNIFKNCFKYTSFHGLAEEGIEVYISFLSWLIYTFVRTFLFSVHTSVFLKLALFKAFR